MGKIINNSAHLCRHPTVIERFPFQCEFGAVLNAEGVLLVELVVDSKGGVKALGVVGEVCLLLQEQGLFGIEVLLYFCVLKTLCLTEIEGCKNVKIVVAIVNVERFSQIGVFTLVPT